MEAILAARIRIGITAIIFLIIGFAGAPQLKAGTETPDESKRLAEVVSGLPELKLPDEWYEIDSSQKLPGRWKEIAHLQIKRGASKRSVNELAADLAGKFFNGGKPFKYTVYFSAANSGAITIVSPTKAEFGTVGWKAIEDARTGKKPLPLTELLAVKRVLN